MSEYGITEAGKMVVELRRDRDAARAEADKLRGVIESLKALLKSEQERFPIDGIGKAVAAEVLFMRDRLACLDANPPEVVRVILEDRLYKFTKDGSVAMMVMKPDVPTLSPGDEFILILPKETP